MAVETFRLRVNGSDTDPQAAEWEYETSGGLDEGTNCVLVRLEEGDTVDITFTAAAAPTVVTPSLKLVRISDEMPGT